MFRVEREISAVQDKNITITKIYSIIECKVEHTHPDDSTKGVIIR